MVGVLRLLGEEKVRPWLSADLLGGVCLFAVWILGPW